jgi:hypothetical protein
VISAVLRLDQLEATCLEADKALLAELARVYPLGAEIQVRCQSNHPRAMPASVIGHHPRGRCGELRVRLAGGHETTVHYTAVVE